jgi:hypothetical protein
MGQLLGIFLNVLAPVFSLVLLGYLVGPRLQLESRTLSRFAYFVLTPAFILDVLSTAQIEATLALRMTVYIVIVQLVCTLIAFIIARALRRSPQMTAAYMLIAVFSNVGNFGLPIMQFAFGDESLVAAAVYFLAILTISFVIGVAAANWSHGGNIGAAVAVVKTPAILALPPALLLNWMDISMPVFAARPISLLAGALIPTMLVALGVQLANVGIARPTFDSFMSSFIRLVVGPALAVLFAIPFGLTGIERDVGVLQASMPAAVLASIIAVENDLLPDFVIAAVLFSTLASVVTITVVLALL